MESNTSSWLPRGTTTRSEILIMLKASRNHYYGLPANHKRGFTRNGLSSLQNCEKTNCEKINFWTEELQDGRGVRRGDHLPPHRYIRNTSTCGTAPIEHPLNAGRRRQTSQKARNSPRTSVGQKKKRNNRDKRIGTGPAPVGGSREGGKVSTH